jgi:hypothetical protein
MLIALNNLTEISFESAVMGNSVWHFQVEDSGIFALSGD